MKTVVVLVCLIAIVAAQDAALVGPVNKEETNASMALCMYLCLNYNLKYAAGLLFGCVNVVFVLVQSDVVKTNVLVSTSDIVFYDN